jgi:hypothetical protein
VARKTRTLKRRVLTRRPLIEICNTTDACVNMPFKYFRISLFDRLSSRGEEWPDVNYKEILDPHEGQAIFIIPADIRNVRKWSSQICRLNKYVT